MRANNRKRQARKGFWGDLLDRLPLVGVFLIMSVLTGTMFFNDEGLPLYFHMHDTREQLAQQIQQLQNINATMTQDIARIQKDPQRLEELARNRLGMVRRGETVYQFVEPAPQSLTAMP